MWHPAFERSHTTLNGGPSPTGSSTPRSGAGTSPPSSHQHNPLALTAATAGARGILTRKPSGSLSPLESPRSCASAEAFGAADGAAHMPLAVPDAPSAVGNGRDDGAGQHALERSWAWAGWEEAYRHVPAAAPANTSWDVGSVRTSLSPQQSVNAHERSPPANPLASWAAPRTSPSPIQAALVSCPSTLSLSPSTAASTSPSIGALLQKRTSAVAALGCLGLSLESRAVRGSLDGVSMTPPPDLSGVSSARLSATVSPPPVPPRSSSAGVTTRFCLEGRATPSEADTAGPALSTFACGSVSESVSESAESKASLPTPSPPPAKVEVLCSRPETISLARSQALQPCFDTDSLPKHSGGAGSSSFLCTSLPWRFCLCILLHVFVLFFCINAGAPRAWARATWKPRDRGVPLPGPAVVVSSHDASALSAPERICSTPQYGACHRTARSR